MSPNGRGNVIAKALRDCPGLMLMLPDSERILHCEIQLDVYVALHYMFLRVGRDHCRLLKTHDQPSLMPTRRAARGN
jgi:hypothetical protein